MQKDITGTILVGTLFGWGPALIYNALVKAGEKHQEHRNELEIAEVEENARRREIEIESKYMAQDNKSKGEIEALRLQIEALQKDKETLNKKVKHLEAEGEMKSEIIAEKNQGKKFDHLVGLMK